MAYDFSKLSVLIIDDLKPMIDVVQTILEQLGVREIYTASDGEEGYAAFNKHRPDLIITDWLMEPVDGLEMVRWIRQNQMSHDRMVPVIVMTGYTASHRVGHARDQGVTEFVAKPFTAAQLVSRITHVIDRPRDFIEAQGFMGPDRRRRQDSENKEDRRHFKPRETF
jgi:CheY-like chemotaxis protein